MNDINQLIKDIKVYYGTGYAIMLRHSKGVIMITGMKKCKLNFFLDRALTKEENEMIDTLLIEQEKFLVKRSLSKNTITDKLTKKVIRCREAGIDLKTIAQKFNVDKSTVNRIIRKNKILKP